MIRLLCWDYCDKCGCRIEVGDDCYEVGEDTYCENCCKHINTMQAWERMVEAYDDGTED